jgi:hypothetical protein
MSEHILSLNKKEVYDEVAKTTSYTGAKKDDSKEYERIFASEDDKQMLERFWQESKNTICNSLKRFVVSEEETGESYTLTLELSSSFDDALLSSMQRSLFSFFVMNITSKWFVIANKPEATEYASAAATNAEDIMRKAFFKKKPQRPTY